MRELRRVQRFVTSAIGLFVLVSVFGVPSPAIAAPSIGTITTNPSHLDLNQRTNVKVTAFVVNADEFVLGAFALERINANGTITILNVFNDLGRLGDQVRGDHTLTAVTPFNPTQSGPIRLRVDGVVIDKQKKITRLISPTFELTAGTITGSGGTTVTIPPNPFPGPVNFVGAIDQVPNSTIVAAVNLPNTPPNLEQKLVAAIEVTLEPRDPGVDLPAPTAPLQITIPLPAGVTDTRFLVAEQVLAPTLGTPGLTPQLRVAAAAVVVGNNIVTQAAPQNPLPGILHSGIYAIVTARGSGYVTGVASDAAGPVQGAIISSNTNAVIAATNATGNYSIFVSGGPFTVSAFNPFRGSTGSATGTIAVDGSTVQANITLSPLATPPVSLDGIRNAGFENCSLPGADVTGNLTGTWAFSGSAKAARQLTVGIPPNTLTFLPTEGDCMLDISSGLGVQNLSGTAGQRFIVPGGARTLSFDYTFISEEFPEFIGTQFDDKFRALITVNGVQTEIKKVEVNEFPKPPLPAVGYIVLTGPGGNIDCFPDGDATCGQITGDVGNPPGWRTATFDLSTVAVVGTPTTVDLLFTVNDAGDNIYDTHVLIDNIRFGTLWVDAKIVQGANANATRVRSDIRSANDVLSQSGLIVRLRNPNGQPAIINNAALLDPDITYTSATTGTCTNQAQLNGVPSSEETLLTAQLRSATTSDVNVYYAGTAFRDGALNTSYVGYAIGPDEFCNQIIIDSSSGIILFDGANSALRAGVPGHEIGHLLIAPDNAFATTEHGTSDSLNFMWGTNTPVNGFMTRQQSFEINQPTNYPGAINKLIVP